MRLPRPSNIKSPRAWWPSSISYHWAWVRALSFTWWAIFLSHMRHTELVGRHHMTLYSTAVAWWTEFIARHHKNNIDGFFVSASNGLFSHSSWKSTIAPWIWDKNPLTPLLSLTYIRELSNDNPGSDKQSRSIQLLYHSLFTLKALTFQNQWRVRLS